MNYYLNNKKINFHLIFLFVLSLYYLIPQILFGQFIIKSHDLLDSEVVYNHIIGKIYRGEFESISFFFGWRNKMVFFTENSSTFNTAICFFLIPKPLIG